MQLLFPQVIQSFASNEWVFEQIPKEEVLQSGFEAHSTTVNLHVQTFEEIRAVSVVATSSIQIQDPDHRACIAELLMRANTELTLGNFEMQWDEGTVMFRLTNLFEEEDYSHHIVTGMVESTVAEMDRITPFLEVILQSSPEELAALDFQSLLAREDLLPPMDE